MEPKRAANGSLVYRADKFPRGIKHLADYAHSKGLKFGIYSAHGARTCMGNAGSGGDEPHWQQDADLFASWVSARWDALHVCGAVLSVFHLRA